MICTVLNENTSLRPELEAEHGLSLHIEAAGFRCLFDFGQTDRWLHNARLLGIETAKLDFAVLSHGHYDHAGGLRAFLDQAESPRVYRGKRCWDARGSLSDGSYRELGIPDREELHARLGQSDDLDVSHSPHPGVHLLIPDNPSFPDDQVLKYVVQHEGGYHTDEFLDELTMVVEENDELVVVTGCSRRGVFTILDEVKERFPQRKIAALVGGLHLRDHSDNEIRSIARTLSVSGVRHFYPCHCTGERAITLLQELMPHRVFVCRTGSRLNLP